MIAALLLGAAAAPAGTTVLPVVNIERDYCPERPGLGTPACTMAPGRVSVETSLADWTLDRDGGERRDTVLIGDVKLRIGLGDTVEAQIGWTPFGIDRQRSGGVERVTGVGDVTLGVKANLRSPDGEGFAIAALPYVTLPVGREGIGAGDWGAGLLLPVSYDLSDTVQLQATPEVDAAVDEDGAGRHLAYGGVAGLAVKLTGAATLTGEAQVERDDDSAGGETRSVAALSLGVMAGDDLQFDLLAAHGLNRASADLQLYGGVSARF